jgi:hypothetical protein
MITAFARENSAVAPLLWAQAPIKPNYGTAASAN